MTDFLTIKHRPKGTPLRVEIQWHCHGNPDNPVLIFLHEGLGCVASWKDLPEQISRATDCNAFTYSRLGYGGSDPVPLPRKLNFMHIEALDLLPQILKAARITKYIIIGHSDGGSIGIIHAGSTKSHGLKGLVTLAAHLFCEPVTLKSIRAARDRYMNNDLKLKLERVHGPNTDTAFWGWNDTWLSPGFVHWNIERYLKTIQVPVTAIQGAQDPYGTTAQLDAMKAKIPHCATRLIEDCGHTPHLEQNDETLISIVEFIRSLLISF